MAVRGADVVAKNIIRFGGNFTKHVNKVMKEVSVIMDNQVTKNMTLEDHTMKVHKRSGELVRSKERGTIDANITFGALRAGAFVKLDENKAEHAKYIIFGTSKMIPRPLLMGSVNQIKNKAFKVIKNNLRDLTMRFVAR